jgi:hypothetical protein
VPKPRPNKPSAALAAKLEAGKMKQAHFLVSSSVAASFNLQVCGTQ